MKQVKKLKEEMSFDDVQGNEMEIENTEEEVLTFASLESKLKDKVKKPSLSELQHEANKLVRCVVTCNNNNKSAYSGEIFSACNAVIPEIKKFIQFGVPYHVPQIILNVIKDKKVQVYRKQRNQDGSFTTVAKEIPEYSIQILPPITAEELEAIKQKQLAEGL